MIEVLRSGFYSSIQDLGISEYMQYGVPLGGSMDLKSSGLANLILNNTKDAALSEMTLTGGKFKFYCDPSICLVGAECDIHINSHLIKRNRRIEINAGDVLNVGSFRKGARLYLGVLGGILSESKLNSRSYSKVISDNGFLKKGSMIKIIPQGQVPPLSGSIVTYNQLNQDVLEVYKGPEFDLIDSLKNFDFNRKYEILSHNRMAYILGAEFKHDFSSMLSSPVFPGVVQLYPSGKLCLLMRDAQVTGGYPRVFVLTENAINILAQKQQKGEVKFRLLDDSFQ
jgi:biotin-dependent carboxylase-like uncharacterized protein